MRGKSAHADGRECQGNRSRVIPFIGLLTSVLVGSAAAQTNLAPESAFDPHDESAQVHFATDIAPSPSDSAVVPALPAADAAIHIGMPPESEPNLFDFRSLADPYIALPPLPTPRFQLQSALRQEFQYLMVEHGFRLAQDRALRRDLLHDPFFQNWFRSFKGYDLKRWGDGDDFLVNGIAHPMQGAVASWIYIQNSPVASTRVIGKDPQYWTSRLKGMAWAAVFEVQWKIGPLGESSIGNAGGWSYVPGCGSTPKCINNPNYPPPTNNTGLSDWILTPVVGTGWVMIEDTIDRFIAAKAAEHRLLYGIILRTALEPTRNFAALFTGVLPWDPAFRERLYVRPKFPYAVTYATEAPWKKNRGTVGFHYVNVSLPGTSPHCMGCRENNPGVGFPFGYRMFEHTHFDSEINLFPAGSHAGGPAVEGLFGMKIGPQGQSWGLFGKVRPGFIYYERAWSGGQAAHFTDLSRFALDMGGAFEIYPSRRSTLRFDFGSTLVRYLQDYPNPHISPIGSLISTDYYVTQGNFQMSAGYRVRF